MTLLTTLNKLLADAFAAASLPTDTAFVQRADRPDLADFQCNGALALAKREGKNPRQMAESVAAHLSSPLLADVSIAGPGFINLTLSTGALNEAASSLAEVEKFGIAADFKQTIVLDYGGPNVAKEMHVGHLRTAIIGEAMKRIIAYNGGTAIGDVHLGDWGKPMGMLIAELALEQPDLPYFDAAKTADYPAEAPLTVTELSALYKRGAARCKEDPAADEAARVATEELQNGRPGYRALWRHFHDESVQYVKENYARLNIYFDLWMGESDVHDLVVQLEQDYAARGVLEQSDGALVCWVEQDRHGNDMPPMIYKTKNGSYSYAATDVASIVWRVQNKQPDQVWYIVDSRQSLHFDQVFDCIRKAGYSADTLKLAHYPNGTINGKDGKPFKTRSGDSVRLKDLIEDATKLAKQQLPDEADGVDIDALAEQIAIAAIKFQDLKNNRASDYMFDEEQFMRFEGKTGPYLQYAVARTNALARKAEEQGVAPAAIHVEAPEEKALVMELLDFETSLKRALTKCDPSHLADHAFRLAQAYSTFYAACPVLAAEDATVQSSRLALALLVRDMLKTELELLAIPSPEIMLKKEG